MKYCKKCGVSIGEDTQRCPLCQGTVQPAPGPSRQVFPLVPTIYRQHSLFFKLLILGSVAAGLLCLVINRMLPQSGYWSLFVVAAIACFWVVLFIAVRKRHSILKNILYQTVVVGILSVLWDKFTGWRGWSVEYAIPCLFMAVMIALPILAKVMKMPENTYLIYCCIFILFGIIPAVFILAGIVQVDYPSLFCVAVSLICLTALLVFEGAGMRAELRRRLHL